MRTFFTPLHSVLFFTLVGLAAMILSLAACGPTTNMATLQPNNPYDLAPKHSTGMTRSVPAAKSPSTIEVPYTVPGSQEIFDQMRTDLKDVTDVFLARTVLDVKMTLTDENNKRVEKDPSRFELNIKMKPVYVGAQTELKFQSSLHSEGPLRIASDVHQENNQKATFPFTASVKCHDPDCRVVEIRIKKHAKNSTTVTPYGEVLGQVGVLYRISYPKIKVQSEIELHDFKSPAFAQLKRKAIEQNGIRTSVAVVNGPAYSRIQVPDLLDVQTELLDTNETAIGVNSVEVDHKTDFSGELVGNDPSTSSLVLDLKDKKTQDSARLYIEESDPVVTTPVEPPTSPSTSIIQGKKSLFPVTLDPKLLPETARVSQAFHEYASDPEVQRMVRVWLGQEKNDKACGRGDYGKGSLLAFLRHAPPISSHLKDVAEKVDVTPEIGYLLLLESAYAKQADYPTFSMPNDTRSTALGPFQIINKTAFGIKEKFGIPFQLVKVKSKQPNASDDRTYFMNSTYLATLLLDSLFERFEPGLAIAAYHAGETSASNWSRGAEKYEKFQISLKDILKYRIQIKANCKQLNYAFAFLGALTIGQNLDAYGLDNIPVTTSTKYKDRLRNPRGVLPAGI